MARTSSSSGARHIAGALGQMKIAKERGFSIHEHSLQIYADCIRVDCPNKPKA
jgi:Fe2+ or Zn2+ uptake regulation protein